MCLLHVWFSPTLEDIPAFVVLVVSFCSVLTHQRCSCGAQYFKTATSWVVFGYAFGTGVTEKDCHEGLVTKVAKSRHTALLFRSMLATTVKRKRNSCIATSADNKCTSVYLRCEFAFCRPPLLWKVKHACHSRSGCVREQLVPRVMIFPLRLV